MLLTPQSLAIRLRITTEAAERMVDRDEVPTVTLPNGEKRVPLASLARWILTNTQGPQIGEL